MQSKKLKKQLYEIIFEADTFAGKLFDIILLIVIFFSISLVMLESIDSINAKYNTFFNYSEWTVTALFTIEYIARIWLLDKPFKYIFSFYGIIDFLSIIPSFLAVFYVGAESLSVIRGLRLLRIFRILKLSRYSNEGKILIDALIESRQKLSVFLFGVLMIVIFIGTVMYIVEGPENGFTSIPESIYWAIVTITTVGYGDIVPHTYLGKFISSALMLLGFAIIAIPTGIVTVNISKRNKKITTQVCPNCLAEGHDPDAVYCKYCGEKL